MDSAPRKKHLVIHGHFYQPPRENPWTEEIDRQEGASPYHDWNDKIANECYLPNALSRRLDAHGRITKLVNNYEWLSFNFGPTLLSYLEDRFPEVYEKILAGDRASVKRLGRGNAIAQCYNHVIMPLASPRDRETQIRWGLRDFERRFGRAPEGIWLPEAAVNDAVLAVLVDHGIRFTILSPYQAQRVRPLAGAKSGAAGRESKAGGDAPWRDVSKGTVAAGFPYRCFAPGAKGKRDRGRFVDVFFYDAPLSTDVSFNHLLRNGDRLAEAIEFGFQRGGDDLVAIATDGEIYGHHEPFADMALSYLVEEAAPRHGFSMTNFAAYLAAREPAFEVELKEGPNGEGTSWSCFHGVGRWKEDCGCSTGGDSSWNQKWRAPLRSGLDALAASLSAAFEEETRGLLADPWAARDDYIELVEERTTEAAKEFVRARASRELSGTEISRVLSLLESQRNAQLMFTSCGWFFADISGLEATQILRYAARAIELAGPARRTALERDLIAALSRAASNVPGKGTGADVFSAARKQSALGARSIAALYAVTEHFTPGEKIRLVYGHPVRPLESILRRMDGGAARAGSLELTSRYTLERRLFEYLVYVEGEAVFACYVKESAGESAARETVEQFAELAGSGSRDKLVSSAAEHFGTALTARDFLPEDRERILRYLTARALEAVDRLYGQIYQESKGLLRLLKDAGVDAPAGIVVPAETHLTKRLVEEVGRWERTLNPAGLEGIRRIVSEAKTFGVPIDTSSAAASFAALIMEKLKLLSGELTSPAAAAVEQFVNLSDEMGIEMSFRDIQNRMYAILETAIAPFIESLGGRSPESREAGKRAAAAFLSLARRFNFNTESWERRLEAVRPDGAPRPGHS
jgi:hypothetical protein